MLPWRRGWWSGVSSRKARSRPFLRIERIEATERALMRMPRRQAASTRALASGQRQDAEAGPKALFGMRPGGDDGLEKRGGRGTNLLAGRDQPTWRPFAVA